MKIFNFCMPDPLRRRLLAERDRTGLSEAEIIRRALDDHLDGREMRRERTHAALAMESRAGT